MIMGNDAGKKICEALQLDPELVSNIEINIRPDDVVTADVLMHLTGKQIDEISVIINGKLKPSND